jgi:hypothetical protein
VNARFQGAGNPARSGAFGLAGAYAWNISHHGFLMHPPLRFITYHERDQQ